MTSRLNNRIMKMEMRTAPVDLEKWRRTPVREMPDWVVISILLDRPVSPAEADRLNKDDEFWRQIELLCAIGEVNDQWDAICGDLVDYVERVLPGACGRAALIFEISPTRSASPIWVSAEFTTPTLANRLNHCAPHGSTR